MNDKLKTIGHLAASVLIAFVLFFYATTTNYKNTGTQNQNQAIETYTYTVNNIPIDIEYDSDEYFISGFASTVSANLIGSNRVILQKETDESTRNFQVKADLKDLSEGNHTVKLQVVNLPTGINITLNPTTISVKIGKRASKTFAVVGKIYDNQLATGFTVGKTTVDLESVKVTSDEETLAKVERVEAVVTDASNLSGDYSGTATLQAVDSDGNILPVVFSQEVTTLRATIMKR